MAAQKKAGASKTARRSMPAGPAAGLAQIGAARLLVPCNAGRNAYVRNPKSSTMPNLSTSSEAFVELVREVSAAGFAAQLRSELGQLAAAHPGHGWETTQARLEEAGALAA